MITNILKRQALGQIAALGALYDARSDNFISLSLMKEPPPATSIAVMPNHSTDIKISKTDTYKEKFDRLDVEAELSASYLAGLVKVSGSGRYLSDKRETNLVMQSSMHYRITTVEEELNLASADIKRCLAFDTFDSDAATHVVTGISWGAKCVITAKSQVALSIDRNKIAGELEAQLSLLKGIGLTMQGASDLSKEDSEQNSGTSFEITIFGDVLSNDGLVPTDFETAQKFISNVHKYIADANQGKGMPITYTLMPLSVLKTFGILEIKSDIIFRQLRVECLEKFVQLFDGLCDSQQTLHDYYARIRNHPAAIPLEHLSEVADCLTKVRATEASLKSDYSRVLQEVRSSIDEASAEKLWRLLEKYQDGECSAKSLQSATRHTEKMDFVEMVTCEGAEYVGYQGSSVDTILASNPHDDAYILYFTDQIRHESPLWTDNLALLLELLRDKAHQKLVLVVDCEASGTGLVKPYISQTRNGRVIVEDVEEQRKILASECIMRYNENTIDRTLTSKPLQRRAVKVPCPHTYCDSTLRCTWICSSCQCIVEFGYVDNFLYCNCGACLYDQWEFKCNDPRHGSAWVKYDVVAFMRLLEALESFEELNILILGETGVGKSTWINAFVNYLTYSSLEEAMQSKTLRCVIPCSFTTQIKDQSDSRGRLVQKKIKIGSSANERDIPGLSATKTTLVYPLDIGSTRVRLIDTPGIGDTGGVEQDSKNMADILCVLRSYSKLHGILILLKPNAPRLTVMFRFCIKQLLTHLHRNAANNIVFGFTNTRGSNYMPGDTFKPLEALLHEYKEVEMGLYEHNVYCFDSESFRYLAARKQGVDMGLLEDNERSWDRSVTECQRLVKHFQTLKPHEVRSTLNLNETRNIIMKLTEPMTVIQGKIQVSIQVNEDEVKELERYQFTRSQLEQKLYVQKESLESYAVDKPRTACTHRDCVAVRDDFGGRQEKTIIYKTVCHKPCWLPGIEQNTKGHPGIERCWAIDKKNGVCHQCGHNYIDHMHIYYEYRPITAKFRDEAVDRDLVENAKNINLKEEAIRMKKRAIAEFEIEYHQVQDAAIQFGFFLKRHAITVYNDATLEYLEHFIDQEKMKIQAGGTKKALKILEKHKADHIEKVKTLEKAIASGDNGQVRDDQGIHQLIDTLYGLPHFGGDLGKIVTTNEKASEAAYREKSFNVSAGAHWNQRSAGKKGKSVRSRHAQTYGYSQYAGQSGGYYPASYAQDLYSEAIPGAFPRQSLSEDLAASASRYQQEPGRAEQQLPEMRYGDALPAKHKAWWSGLGDGARKVGRAIFQSFSLS